MNPIYKQLRDDFLIIRRIFKNATNYGKEWGGNLTETTHAWDRFEKILNMAYKKQTGLDLEQRVILRKRGRDDSFNVESDCRNDRSHSEDVEAVEQNTQAVISKNIEHGAGQSIHD